jgi:hypothetical protein
MRASASETCVPSKRLTLGILLLCCAFATSGPAGAAQHRGPGVAQAPGEYAGTAQAASESPISTQPSEGRAERTGRPGSTQAEPTLQQLTAAVHVHTTASTGSYSLSTLSDVARNEGIDAVVLGENLQLDFRFGPWPLRFFFELNRTLPSLRQHGIGDFLEELEEVHSARAGPLYLLGVEVMPHYYWTGSLAGRTKTIHNVQRNMLVVVPPPVEGKAVDDVVDQGRTFLRNLPAIGNPGGEKHDWRSLAKLLPGIFLLGYGIRRLLQRQSGLPISWRGGVRALIGGNHPQLPMKEVAVRALLLVGGLYLLVHNYPYSIPLHSHYDPDAGLVPYQGLIDSARQQGGLVYWSMPEASDYRDLSVGPVTVRLSTEPYSDAVSETTGHTGFAGVYAQNVTMLDAGGPWDAVLKAYCKDERVAAPWVIGEGAFHYTGQAQKRLSDVLTVLWVQEATRAEVFGALARGRSYALRQKWPESLRLREFTLGVPSTGQLAWPGDTMELAMGVEGTSRGELGFEIVVEMSAESGGAMPVRVEIIRQGKLYRSWEETTPFRRQISEALEPGDDHVYYRVMAYGPEPHRVVSNPIFVRRQ